MKKKTHPDYQEILFEDSSNGYKFVCGSTLKPQEKATFEGKEYPLYRVPISSASHPFYTGSKQFIDTEGRMDKFAKKYAKKKEAMQKEMKMQEEAQKAKVDKKKKKGSKKK